MKRFRLIKVTSIWATNTKPARIKITDTRYKKSKIISYDFESHDIFDCAKKYLESLGVKIDAEMLDEEGLHYLTESFEPINFGAVKK